MPFEPGSLEDVEAWAQHEFANYFAALSTFPIADQVRTSEFDGESVDGKIVLQSLLILALPVGVTAAGTNVYARIAGGSDVVLFRDHKVRVCDETGGLSCIVPLVELDGIGFTSPFRYCTESGHPSCIDWLETLIRYAFLKSGDNDAVRLKLGFFKAHFRGACRAVARGVGALTEADENADDETLPGDSPPGLIEDTDVGTLHDNPSAISIFNQHVHTMDESYHNFKTNILHQIGSMQTRDRDIMLQLQTQNQDLTRRLAAAEQSQMEMSKELETLKMEMKSALKESKKWKKQYEGLKGTLQDVLGQQSRCQ